MIAHNNAVCLVEDDAVMGQSLVDRFQYEQIACDWYTSLESARLELASKNYAAVICDLRLPDGSGEALLTDRLAKDGPSPPIMFITAYSDLRHAVRLLRQGAADYVTKPFDMDNFLRKLYSTCPALEARGDRPELPPDLGVSKVMREIQGLLKHIADHDVPALITGESGVGKEYAARYLHDSRSGAASRPFVAVNCAAIPETLLESELFGHEKGSFTGSSGAHTGLFEQAHGGTLFLDEIGDMPLSMQTKVLRAIQEKCIRRVGGSRDIPVDFRLICATNRDLKQMVREGEFRKDLFFRINIFPVHIPPLRERMEDVIWFAELFVNEYRQRSGRLNLRLSTAAKAYLRSLDWSGNIRELRARIDRMCILCDGDVIGVTQASFNGTALPAHQQTGAAPVSLSEHLNSCERAYILQALDCENWCIGSTAARLQISRKSLWERMRKHGIDKSEKRTHQGKATR